MRDVPSDWDALLGNEGTASAFRGDNLYFQAGRVDASGGVAKVEIASISVREASVSGHWPLQLGLGDSGLLGLAVEGES